MKLEVIEKEASARREPFLHWHWQNLNEKWPKGVDRSERHGEPKLGWGLREGRCWWHFRSKDRHPGNTIEFSWNLWTHFCGVGFDINDEDLTIQLAFPPFAFWLSFSTHFKWIDRFAPKKALDAVTYPGVIVIDERECSLKIHSGSVWLKPWGGDDWTRTDPWWKRGISFSVNPFEPIHMRHEVRCISLDRAGPSVYWEPFVGSWEVGEGMGIPIRRKDGTTYIPGGKRPDRRGTIVLPYHYMLQCGEIQTRKATVYIERRAWRPKCLKWTSLFEKVRTSIDVTFNEEVGERSGSWKGGTTGCGWELLPGESAEQALRRMEAVRKFN